ncbi:hypothetical protein CBP36_19695 (plasmid) [Acidovorax carolinensis]|uniref:Uncharacterized protein n=2 Tax=Acidovorax carolinensis TaxID=553814 RepID=A0A240UI69_9BURK|nr:hypothetical protein CBP35_19650 [Acidovorax carolinensis]ART61191.1 hypothetical protein CBP36_19695 [Acidovorax carolinensis]
MAWAESDAKTDQHASDLKKMRERLEEQSSTAFYQEAFKLAAAEVLNDIITEVKQENDGVAGARRLSDPSNADLRNEAYVEAIARQVNRISGGTVNVSRMSQERIKKARVFK